jgi:hypothetical protein
MRFQVGLLAKQCSVRRPSYAKTRERPWFPRLGPIPPQRFQTGHQSTIDTNEGLRGRARHREITAPVRGFANESSIHPDLTVLFAPWWALQNYLFLQRHNPVLWSRRLQDRFSRMDFAPHQVRLGWPRQSRAYSATCSGTSLKGFCPARSFLSQNASLRGFR